jgi:hypothetical protein
MEDVPRYAHPPITWRVDHVPLPDGFAITEAQLAGATAQSVSVMPFPDDGFDLSDGARPVADQRAEREAVNLQVALLEVGPLLIVGACALTSSFGHQHHALTCVRDGAYWALYRDHNAARWVALQLSGDMLDTVSPLPA